VTPGDDSLVNSLKYSLLAGNLAASTTPAQDILMGDRRGGICQTPGAHRVPAGGQSNSSIQAFQGPKRNRAERGLTELQSSQVEPLGPRLCRQGWTL